MTGDGDKKDSKARAISITDRKSKVTIEDFAGLPEEFSWYSNLCKMIPRILKGRDLEDLSERVVRARREGRPVIMMMGAHVVKCGFGRLIGELIREDLLTAIAMNGACAIHDVEIAMWGKTSEDVEHGLESGEFGMAEETARFFSRAAGRSLDENIGLGRSLGSELLKSGAPNRDVSIIAATQMLDKPLTVHVALGTDIVHQHEEADGKAIGHGTMKDFRRFASLVADLDGGVILNVGSAVIMPEVFLKALAMARNSRVDLGGFTTANFDMFSLYRPIVNIVRRPRLVGATTYSFLGHHEILLPVFFASVLSRHKA